MRISARGPQVIFAGPSLTAFAPFKRLSGRDGARVLVLRQAFLCEFLFYYRGIGGFVKPPGTDGDEKSRLREADGSLR